MLQHDTERVIASIYRTNPYSNVRENRNVCKWLHNREKIVYKENLYCIMKAVRARRENSWRQSPCDFSFSHSQKLHKIFSPSQKFSSSFFIQFSVLIESLNESVGKILVRIFFFFIKESRAKKRFMRRKKKKNFTNWRLFHLNHHHPLFDLI